MTRKNTSTALKHLASLPFVQGVRFLAAGKYATRQDDGILEVNTRYLTV
jgi:hypothetical protein